jgi:hypothetical protein
MALRRKGKKLPHYTIAARGVVLSSDVAMTPRMVERLKEMASPVVALEIKP